MKTILRIIMILLVASAVSGAFSLAVDNSSVVSRLNEDRQSPSTTSADGQFTQPAERPEGGDHEGRSIAQGLSGVLASLMKLAGITLLILLAQKVFNLLGSLKWKFAQQ